MVCIPSVQICSSHIPVPSSQVWPGLSIHPEHLPLLKPGSKTPADQDAPAQMERDRARLERTSCTRSQVRNAAEKAADLCPSQVFKRKERKTKK